VEEDVVAAGCEEVD
jgi:hypothetical protein